MQNYLILEPLLSNRLRTRTRDEWIAALRAEGVPCGSVRDVAGVLEDPHLSAREMIQAVEHATAGGIRVLGVPIKLSETPGAVRTAPPTLGQDTDRILGDDSGLSAAEIKQLRDVGAV